MFCAETLRVLTAGLSGLLTVVCVAAGTENSSSGELAAALEEACSDPEPSFHLQVHRTDKDGMRSLELFPSGVAVWRGDTQIRLDGEIRSKMIAHLVRHDFVHMEPVFGGKKGTAKGAMRITCRVELEIGGVSKSSAQLADGELSAELAALADAILDLAEPVVEHGVSATDLSDGLRKLAKGTLAAESLQFRFVRLPPAGGAGDGSIQMMSGGVESRKAYTPGRHIGEEVVSVVTSRRLAAVAAALLEADVASMPANLWSGDHIELGVQVLGHRKAVVARDFERLKSNDANAAQKRFDRLVAFLLEF